MTSIFNESIQFAEYNELVFKTFPIDKRSLFQRELNWKYVAAGITPVFTSPTKRDCRVSEDRILSLWFHTLVGKKYIYDQEHYDEAYDTYHHIVIYAKTLGEIDLFISYLDAKYNPVIRQIGSMYTWSVSYYNRTDKLSECLSEDKYRGMDGAIKLVNDDIHIMEKHASKLKELGMTSGMSYLLYGPQGTGKTSFAKLLSHKYNRPLYIVNLSQVKPELLTKALNPGINAVGQSSIVLVEDFDRYYKTSYSEECKSHLLNALDGVFSDFGVIRLFSANNVSDINDRAMLARMRRVMYFGPPSYEDIHCHLSDFHGETNQLIKDISLKFSKLKFSLRTINNYISRYIGYPNPLECMTEHLEEYTKEQSKFEAACSSE